jgi:hypothetical protein
MFTSLKKGLVGIAAVGALALGAGQAQAANIGGINVTPGAHFETGTVYENFVAAAGHTLGGYGSIDKINGNAAYCTGGLGACELTFQFGGFTVTHFNAAQIVFSGGWVNFYVQQTSDAGFTAFNPFASGSDAAAIASATDGDLWLTLAGHTTVAPTGTFGVVPGTLFSTANAFGPFGSGSDAGFGGGLLSVANAGGLADAVLDTNSIADAIGGFADMLLTSSFSPFVVPYTTCNVADATANGTTGCLAGSSDLRGLVVPEPGTLSVLGLGLLGLAAVRRRRQVA